MNIITQTEQRKGGSMGIISKKTNDGEFLNQLTKALEYKNEKLLKECNVALHCFLLEPKKELNTKIKAMKNIQATGVTVSSDLPAVTTDTFNVSIEKDNFDMGWEAAFKQVPIDKGKRYWEIYNIANSLSFSKVEEGQKLEQAGFSGTRQTAEVDYYGGAIGWTDAMVRFRELAAMLDAAGTFRNKFWANKGNIHYALLSAAAALTVVAWQGVAADGRTLRDILTLNQAAYQLGYTNRNKGYGDTANMPMLLYANVNDEERIEAAFRVTSGQLVAARENGIAITGRRVKRIYTYNAFISSGSPILILPGNKLQKADTMPPTTFGPELDILSLNRVQTVWAIFGAIIGDTEQCIQLTLG
jgi:hypothetical protein